MTKNQSFKNARNRGRNRPPRGKAKDKASTAPAKKKTLTNYYYNTGSAKNTSKCVSTTKFL